MIDGEAEGGRKIESDPAVAQITRLRTRPLIPDQSRVTDRDGLIIPSFGKLSNYFNHFHRRQFLSGSPLSRLCLSAGQDFDARSAYVDG